MVERVCHLALLLVVLPQCVFAWSLSLCQKLHLLADILELHLTEIDVTSCTCRPLADQILRLAFSSLVRLVAGLFLWQKSPEVEYMTTSGKDSAKPEQSFAQEI